MLPAPDDYRLFAMGVRDFAVVVTITVSLPKSLQHLGHIDPVSEAARMTSSSLPEDGRQSGELAMSRADDRHLSAVVDVDRLTEIVGVANSSANALYRNLLRNSCHPRHYTFRQSISQLT